MMSQPPGTNVAVVAVNKSAHATVDETLLMFLRWAKKKLMTILKSSSKKCGGGAGVTIAGHVPECVGEEHTFFAFDLNLSSEIFSQAVHETFDCIIIVLLAVCVVASSYARVDHFHAFDGE